MSVILSSKVFEVSKEGIVATVSDIESWLLEKYKTGGCVLEVTLRQVDQKRRGKQSAVDELEGRIIDARLAGMTSWNCVSYEFDFAKKIYKWRRKKIHLTANEALFLFDWLVANDSTCEKQMHFLRNMRRRLGAKFLQEVSP